MVIGGNSHTLVTQNKFSSLEFFRVEGLPHMDIYGHPPIPPTQDYISNLAFFMDCCVQNFWVPFKALNHIFWKHHNLVVIEDGIALENFYFQARYFQWDIEFPKLV